MAKEPKYEIRINRVPLMVLGIGLFLLRRMKNVTLTDTLKWQKALFRCLLSFKYFFIIFLP